MKVPTPKEEIAKINLTDWELETTQSVWARIGDMLDDEARAFGERLEKKFEEETSRLVDDVLKAAQEVLKLAMADTDGVECEASYISRGKGDPLAVTVRLPLAAEIDVQPEWTFSLSEVIKWECDQEWDAEYEDERKLLVLDIKQALHRLADEL